MVNFNVDVGEECDSIKRALVNGCATPRSKENSRSKKRKLDIFANDSSLEASPQLESSPSKTNRSKNRCYFPLPKSVVQELRDQFSFDPNLSQEELHCLLGWIFSRTNSIKKLFKELVSKYGDKIYSLPDPFANYEEELKLLLMTNETLLKFHFQNGSNTSSSSQSKSVTPGASIYNALGASIVNAPGASIVNAPGASIVNAPGASIVNAPGASIVINDYNNL